MDTPITTTLLFSALAVIMFGLGLSLTAADFARVLKRPTAVLTALICQLVVLPAICFLLVTVLDLKPALAVGMMLLAAAPGGASANLYSHLIGGDVSLNITLTAVNTMLAPLTLPTVVNLSAAALIPTAGQVNLGVADMAQVFAVILIPVAAGMLVRRHRPRLTERASKPTKIFSTVFLVTAVAAAAVQERANILDYAAAVGLAALAFGVISMTVGYGVPRLLWVEHRQAIACAMEIGVHNSALAITIALDPGLLNNAEMAIPAAVYSIVIFATAMLFGFLISRRNSKMTSADAVQGG